MQDILVYIAILVAFVYITIAFVRALRRVHKGESCRDCDGDCKSCGSRESDDK